MTAVPTTLAAILALSALTIAAAGASCPKAP
ncbi:putative membrane protein [Corynebacterium glutamicum MB001]|nr:putative membrane protein [Corynebacterium glutamicum MB001]QYO73293.1 putative membrane protein [Corynebacterium glutamicum]CAF19768.1 putative membrane protein [Corynebacterium glutamicum ATCC 13032]